MPMYKYICGECGSTNEGLFLMDADAPICCGNSMNQVFQSPADVTWGTDRSPTRRWYRDWYPGKPEYSTGRLHGQRY
ncbi:hypothetical protein LCGC14_1202470 [marine sediment metagenome]|uniref:Uncharacterized protein n=1 Tax=marine sediment metagenome TaxID=412755 RepID=A0A0F9LGH8_9ZZZZ